MKTPAWIKKHIEEHDGGWFYPIVVTEGHPLLGWVCPHCDEGLLVGSIAFIMPSTDGEGETTWTSWHKYCVKEEILGAQGDEWPVGEE